MSFIIAIFVFVVGLMFGSFINAFQYRQEKNISINGRSFCPKCKHKLAWYDLIPVVSWVLLFSKCRYCKKPISIQYPLIELATGFLFVGIGLKSGLIGKLHGQIIFATLNWDMVLAAVQLILLLAITTLLIIIALHDAKTGYILSALAYLGVVLSGFYLTLTYTGSDNFGQIVAYLLPFLLSGIILSGLFFSISLFSKEKWMGAGDAEIALFIGIFLGWPKIITAFYVALFVGISVACFKMLAKKATLKSEIPFGPFLVIGTFAAYFFADNLISFYAKIFLGA